MNLLKKQLKIIVALSGIMAIYKLASMFWILISSIAGFTSADSSIGIIDGADGPTTIFVGKKFLPDTLPQLLASNFTIAVEFVIYSIIFVLSIGTIRKNNI